MPGINIRRAMGTLAFTYSRAIPKSTATKQLLLGMLNANTMGRTVAMNELEFSFPELNTYHNKNTKVKVKFVGIGYGGSTYFYYDRVLIERSFLAPDNKMPSVPANTTIYMLLPLINSTNRSALTVDDVEDAPVKANAVGLYLVAKSTSYLYLPGSTVLLGSPPPTVDNQIKVKSLAGFDAA